MSPIREVYVISDLHLGGPPGFQCMRRPKALASFIDALAEPSAGHRELVIAGDFVDFLAEGDPNGGGECQWRPLLTDDDIAVARFNRIASRPEFAPVFAALAAFLRAGRRLTILLGNHDIELSYPLVRQALERVLGAREGERFRFICDNEAYRVGDALIEHGNRYDRWNQVDHDQLRQVRSLQSRGEIGLRDWRLEPPAGSRLVADVMNPIKRDYGFVDLLKPENETVVPLLLLLAPDRKGDIVRAVGALAHGLRHNVAADGLPVMMRDASAVGAIPALIDEPFAADASSPTAGAAKKPTLESELARAFGSRAAAVEFMSAADEESVRLMNSSALSLAEGVAAALLPGSPDKKLCRLLKAFHALQSDRSFDETFEPIESPYFKAADRLAEDPIRYVIFGHTHLARQIHLGDGRYYFNSGTWADLMRLPRDIFGDGEDALAAFRRFLDDLHQNRLDAYCCFTPSCVRLELGPDGLVAHASLETAAP